MTQIMKRRPRLQHKVMFVSLTVFLTAGDLEKQAIQVALEHLLHFT
jgi:hypothetical protein